MSQKMRIKRRENLYWDAQTQTVQEGRPVQKKVAIIEYWTDEEIKEIEEMVTISVNRMMINAETEAEFEGWEFIAAEHMISVDQLRLDIIRKEFSRIIAIEDRIALQVLRGILTE